jgi:exo-beta-1,3-glucanase (GH17 family)
MSIFGIAFEPYVGPWVAGAPVYYNAYSLDTVKKLLAPVAEHFPLILTYGQGTFVWEGDPKVSDSNKFNIQAAKAAGIQVSAGCFQQGVEQNKDFINVDWTKVEVDYAIQQAKQYKNCIDLVIGNECIWGPISIQAIMDLIAYAKAKRAPLTPAQLPITTRQRWDVLAAVDNSGYNLQQQLKALLAACEKQVYATMYAYFDSDIGSKIGNTQASFTAAVTNSMNDKLTALQQAFTNQGIGLEIRIGETGWPTKGSQPQQPDGSIANVRNAQWYYEAMVDWADANNVKTVVFEAYDEPWKGPANGSNSEAFFGVWKANGLAPKREQYTLTGTTQKYNLSQPMYRSPQSEG